MGPFGTHLYIEPRMCALATMYRFTDMKITCTLGLNEPSGQDAFDTSSSNDGDFVFDELGLMTYVDGSNATTASSSGELLTHVIFHPVQKSLNRIIEVVYTLRIQMT